MKSVFEIDDNGQGMEELRTFLCEHGYSATESSREFPDILRFNQFVVDRTCVQVFWHSGNGDIIYVNDSACQALGYTREELCSMTFLDIVPALDEKSWKEYKKGLRAEGFKQFESIHRRKDGTTFPVEVTVNYMEFGEDPFSCSFVQDITERKKIETALRESEEKFHLLTEISPNPIVLIQGERIVYVNPAAAEICGFTMEEPIGAEFWKFVHEEFRDIARKRLVGCLRGKPFSNSHEYKIVTQNGCQRWVTVSGVPMEYEGKPAFIIILVDITERKRAEEERKILEAQLHQAQKMEAIGQLAGGVAHDFNNILTAIMGFAEVMAMRMDRKNPLQHHISQIMAASDRAADLIHGLLAFSRKQILHKKDYDVREIVYGVKKMLRRLIPEDIDFIIKCTASNMFVNADKGQIEQVLMNLVTNARDAMPNGGILMIEAIPYIMDEDFIRKHGFGLSGTYSRLSVMDTGCGMDKETLNKIFEPFFTTKKAGKGTGLGLSIIYGIVKQHHGFITVGSSPGCGTTFHLYLPLVDQKADEQAGEQPYEAAPNGTETVLLAEDDDMIRDLHRTFLEAMGYSVIDAVDGREALEKFQDNNTSVDVLVTDIVMPNLDGKMLYEEIRKIRPDMKVLFMSGYSIDILDSRGIAADSVNFVKKPIMESDFLKKLRKILDHKEIT